MTTAERFAADYQKSAQAADAQLTTIYAELERLDLKDNTVVIVRTMVLNLTKPRPIAGELTPTIAATNCSAFVHQLAW